MKLLAVSALVILPLAFTFTSLLSQQDREVSAFHQRAAEDAVMRRLMLEQLERERGDAEKKIAQTRAAGEAERQFFEKANNFRLVLLPLWLEMQEHKSNKQSFARVDKAWHNWRRDPGWNGPKE
jgi:hypothetical protein